MKEWILNLINFENGCKLQIFRSPGQYIQLTDAIECQISVIAFTLICAVGISLLGWMIYELCIIKNKQRKL